MHIRKYRWSRDYEAAEEDLTKLLERKKIDAERRVLEEFEVFELHRHTTDNQLWCAEGSIRIITDSQRFSLQAGDALDLPAGTAHRTEVGFSGCTLYQAPPVSQNPSLPPDASASI